MRLLSPNYIFFLKNIKSHASTLSTNTVFGAFRRCTCMCNSSFSTSLTSSKSLLQVEHNKNEPTFSRILQFPKTSSLFLTPSRFKTSRSKGQQRGKQSRDEDEEEEEDDEENENEGGEDQIFDEVFPEDENWPSNYKERKVHLKSMRLDAVLSAGLNISRKKAEDCFLGSKIFLNGDKPPKKSFEVVEGDYIDLDDNEDGTTKKKRVRVVKVAESNSGRPIVYLRSWKAGFSETDS